MSPLPIGFHARREESEHAARVRRNRRRRRRRAENRRLKDRFADLENALGQALLLVRGLSEVCLQKGVLSEEELTEALLRIDAEDGEVDGKVAPGDGSVG